MLNFKCLMKSKINPLLSLRGTKQSISRRVLNHGLPRRYAPRNDGVGLPRRYAPRNDLYLYSALGPWRYQLKPFFATESTESTEK